MEVRVITEWFRSNDRPLPDSPEHVVGRMVELTRGDKVFPAIEHKVEAASPPSRDVSLTWAVPEKLSEKDFKQLTMRFSRTFEAYEKAKIEMAAEEARKEAEIQARIDAEVAAQLATKAKKAPKEE